MQLSQESRSKWSISIAIRAVCNRLGGNAFHIETQDRPDFIFTLYAKAAPWIRRSSLLSEHGVFVTKYTPAMPGRFEIVEILVIT
jgi:hypothetical protein